MRSFTKELEQHIRKELYENIFFSLPCSYEAAFAKNALYDLLAEIDRLRTWASHFHVTDLEKELDELRKMTSIQDREISWAVDQVQLEEENKKLSERIANLREVFSLIHNKLAFDGCRAGIPLEKDIMYLCKKALTQDDELDKK